MSYAGAGPSSGLDQAGRPRWNDPIDGRLRYEVVDVFTDRPFAGNPLAVVYGADGLATEQLHAIAMEFNLSETTFPAAPTDDDRAAGADYRVRIFTPGGEIPFAGHPTLGTAWSLRRTGLIGSGDRKQACGAGLIGVRVPDDQTRPVELSALPRDHARQLSRDDAATLAELVGLDVTDVTGTAYAAGCGLSWLYLPVTRAAVNRSRPAARRVAEAGIDLDFLQNPVDGVNVYAAESADPDSRAGRDGRDDRNGREGWESSDQAETGDTLRVESRVYVPGYGIPEDPATGSAAAGLGLVLVASGLVSGDGESAYVISQGVAMGRPSLLRGRVEAIDGQATIVHVAGQVVPVSAGTIAIP